MSKEREFIRLWYENIELWKVHAEEPEHSEKGLKENIRQMAVEIYKEGFEDGIRFAENAQQPEQEPVAWMWTRNYEGGGYTNKVFEFLNDAEEYAKDSKTLKSPDIIRPLYTAPPTREPLSDGATADMYHANKKATHPDSYWSGVYDAEKAHGIGGGG